MTERTPYPDEAHEHLASWVEDTVASLDVTSGDAELALALADLVFLFLEEAVTARREHAELLEAHRIRIDAVNVRADTAIDNADLLQRQVAEMAKRIPKTPEPPTKET